MGINPSKQTLLDPSASGPTFNVPKTDFSPYSVTCILSHPEMLLHKTSQTSQECPNRLAVIHQALRIHFGDQKLLPYKTDDGQIAPLDPSILKSGGLCFYEAPLADRSLLEYFHTKAYVEKIFAQIPSEGEDDVALSPDLQLTPGTMTACLRAIGAVTAAVDLLFSKRGYLNAFCAIRPPGSHAYPNKSGGFSIFNNIAIGALYAMKTYKECQRVAIINIDSSHGCGTQKLAEENPNVLYISIHQHPHFPQTGFPSKLSNVLNIPIQTLGKKKLKDNSKKTQQLIRDRKTTGTAHSDVAETKNKSASEELLKTFLSLIIPKILAHKPHLLFLNFGLTSHIEDITSELCFSSKDYIFITEQICGAALSGGANGRVISVFGDTANLRVIGDVVPKHIRALLKAQAPEYTNKI